jgi:predicted nucleic acid-binding protein
MKIIQNKNIFVDANVICDLLLDRKYHARNVETIFHNARNHFITLYVCSYTFAIGYYRMRHDKNKPHRIALCELEKLFQKVKCISVDGNIIQQAMKSGFEDYEDAIQYGCALKIPDCEFIITHDTKGFVLSSVPVVAPQTFLRHHLKKPSIN